MDNERAQSLHTPEHVIDISDEEKVGKTFDLGYLTFLDHDYLSTFDRLFDEVNATPVSVPTQPDEAAPNSKRALEPSDSTSKRARLEDSPDIHLIDDEPDPSMVVNEEVFSNVDLVLKAYPHVDASEIFAQLEKAANEGRSLEEECDRIKKELAKDEPPPDIANMLSPAHRAECEKVKAIFPEIGWDYLLEQIVKKRKSVEVVASEYADAALLPTPSSSSTKAVHQSTPATQYTYAPYAHLPNPYGASSMSAFSAPGPSTGPNQYYPMVQPSGPSASLGFDPMDTYYQLKMASLQASINLTQLRLQQLPGAVPAPTPIGGRARGRRRQMPPTPTYVYPKIVGSGEPAGPPPLRMEHVADRLPMNWINRDHTINYRMVQILYNSNEYNYIDRRVRETNTAVRIVKIERVENPTRYKQYTVQKDLVEARNPPEGSERWLFHGTSRENIDGICTEGFNRSVAKNNVMYGHGSYFARDFTYSESYSGNNTQGRGRVAASQQFQMFCCFVLTGWMTLGSQNTRELPFRVPANKIRYDSAVDRLQNPSIFVVFTDFNAYPAYLITFEYPAAPGVV